MDPDVILRSKILEFVSKGDFGLASGSRSDGSYDRIWFEELLSPDEVTFEANVFLITKAKAKALKTRSTIEPIIQPLVKPDEKEPPVTEPVSEPKPGTIPEATTLTLRGTIPPEIWNRLGTKLITKLRSGNDLKIDVSFSVAMDGRLTGSFESELRQILDDLNLTAKIRVERS